MRLIFYISFCAVALAFTSLASSQEPPTEDILISFCKKAETCGYMTLLGDEMIAPEFQAADEFSNGLAWVRKDGLWGAIDRSGNYVITPKFLAARDFDENGFARVNINNQWGVINRQGKTVIPPEYKDIGLFTEGVAAFQDWGTNLVGLISDTGKVILPPKYEYLTSLETLPARVRLNGKWGYIDLQGNEVTPIQFDAAKPFKEGFAQVGMQADEIGLRKHYGFINTQGQIVIDIKYTSASAEVSGGRVSAKLDGKTKFLDMQGQEVCEKKYDYVGPIEHGLAVLRHKGEFGVVNRNCEIVVPPDFDSIFIYEDVIKFRTKRGKSGHMSHAGEILFTVPYRQIHNFSEDMLMFENRGKTGFLSRDLEIAIPAKYETGYGFVNGLALVWKKGEPFYLTKNGKEIGPVDVPLRPGKTHTKVLVCDGKSFAIDPDGNPIGFDLSEFKTC